MNKAETVALTVVNKNKRNYGIDLLRIIAMLFIVIFHCLGQGGLVNNVTINTPQYKLAWFMNICTCCAVDIFAIISGYVYYRDKEKNIKYSNYFNLWLQIVFLGLVITAVFNIINPSLVNKKMYLQQFFPVTNNLLWYFTSYTGLFVMMPLINKGIRNCSVKTLKKLFILMIIAFSFLNVIDDLFILNKGYSMEWIIILYVFGAIIKKCKIGENLKWYQILITILAMYLITFIFKMSGKEIEYFDNKITGEKMMYYLSPTILITAIMYVIGFSKLKINGILQKFVKVVAPSAFTIYIINNNKLVWDNVFYNRFANMTNSMPIKIFLSIMGFAICFSIFAILIDKIRIFIFKKLHVKKLAEIMANLLNKLIGKISELLI